MTQPRSNLTRILHLLLLAIVINQLVGSNFMQKPLPGESPDLAYSLHIWAGMSGFVIVALFWLWAAIRQGETRLTALVPWFTTRGRQAFLEDCGRQARAIRGGRLLDDEHGAFASAIHGLGLLTLTFMAASGTLYYLIFEGTALGRTVLGLHKMTAKLMWAYLIGHATLAIVHHFCGSAIFSRMFWAGRRELPLGEVASRRS
ncbi:MAG: cytochrome b/b6 domain-containing protein [Hyphomicrobiales bacterium]